MPQRPIDADLQDELIRRFGLVRGALEDLTIERRRRGKGFSYHHGQQLLRRERDIARIAQLAIPPAWSQVRIAPLPELHLQALGKSPTDRLQYLYHPRWSDIRETLKFERLKRFASALPGIRRTVRRDLRARTLSPDFMCAAAIRLIDETNIRVGSWVHNEQTGTRGATTLLTSDIDEGPGRSVALSFRAKGGKEAERQIDDNTLARILHKLADLPGRYLFDVTLDGDRFRLTAGQLNAYLRAAGGAAVSAKDFRTFAASSQALAELAPIAPPASQRARQRQIMDVARQVAARLGNTPAMAKNSYIHRSILERWEKGQLSERLIRGRRRAELSREETALARFLDEFDT
ncbi:DNA topoisomerase IB [Pseudohoeflea coraliihabitans]|uniref:DNA topoisomerase IB n=1 Tax=Pseudohoeflea coraliihabitans TaxID=2860393 RepID=A0ABS6WKD1_9HYPH|nr:DNA topoisomerase IB [Pseudohoeflea sp. DP4N28-3]MBW3096406.1 DNA topoisomerase IB [Pseudohoeflea sp. DP4N28-3]